MGPCPLVTTPVSKPTPLPPAAVIHHHNNKQLVNIITTPAIEIATATAPKRFQSSRSGRRELAIIGTAGFLLLPAVSRPASAAIDEEYVKDTSEVISKVRSTISIDKKDPSVASAVAELRDASNSWVAKYRREKALLGRASFRDIYAALNAVSGHYISFGPTAPIPAKRKARILEEVDTGEKALLRGR